MNLKSAVEDILFSKEDFYLITRGINTLYENFSEATQVFAADLTHEHLIDTPNGGVVTPVRAAHCLKDIGRTTHFLRGIHKAVEHFLKNQNQIRILYAGCGPYATLLTPFTALYPPEKLRYTFLEIEKTSVVAVNKLYRDWKLTSYLDEVRLADATDPGIRFDEPFDMIISETMQMGLKNECQVPITRNLVRFLTPEGTFIPQQIRLDIYVTGMKKDALIPDSDEKEFVGTAYNLDFRNVPGPNAETVLRIPDTNLPYLKLFTNITLFDDEKLTVYQSGLTLPLTLDQVENKAGRLAKFRYIEGHRPKLILEYVKD